MKLSDRPIDYAQESNWVIVHFDKENEPVRIEILDARRFLKEEKRVLPLSLQKEYFSGSSSASILHDE
ncbi:MAG TPA: DUF2283 domain-containing protein [Patescibacteria group bacterium]|nr:DUF2283 domain-containing protein [Patescibacteria group bacterium]